MQTTTVKSISLARYYLSVYRAEQPYALRQQAFQVYAPEIFGYMLPKDYSPKP